MNNKKGGILKSFLEFFYGNFIVLLLGFISLPLITRVMSTDEYGRSAMYQSVVSIIYIFAILGLDQAYIRYFYVENIDRKKLFLKCLYPALLLILAFSFAYLVFSDRMNIILFGKTSLDVTLLVIGYAVTSVFERFVFLNIRMEQNGKLYSNLNILSKVLYIAFIFLFVYILGDDFRVVLYALTLPLIIVTILLLVRFYLKNRNTSKTDVSVSEKELLAYGIPFVPMLLMEWLLSSMDRWSIRFFNDFSETGIYSAAMQIMVILSTFKITYVAFWAPIAMEKYEKEDEKTCREFFADMFLKVQFLAMSAAFMLTIFRGIIVMILGARFRDAMNIIPFLTLMPILSILFEMTGQGVKFVKKIKYFNYASLLAIVCNLIGNAILVPMYKGIGAAIATGITYIVYFAAGTYFSKKCYPVSYDLKGFIVSVGLYIAYAFYATFGENLYLSAFVGIIVFVLHCLINIKVIRSLLELSGSIIRKLLNKA